MEKTTFTLPQIRAKYGDETAIQIYQFIAKRVQPFSLKSETMPGGNRYGSNTCLRTVGLYDKEEVLSHYKEAIARPQFKKWHQRWKIHTAIIKGI